ncbi:MAG: hypothetical protein M0Z41_11390 [Peptococcaceae bacterium]|jgi:hypothetical protein|nr:hypothetical protein [Peptococcaceae bacterium]
MADQFFYRFCAFGMLLLPAGMYYFANSAISTGFRYIAPWGWEIILIATLAAIFTVPVADAGTDTMIVPYACVGVDFVSISAFYHYGLWAVAGGLVGGWTLALAVYVMWRRCRPVLVGTGPNRAG